MSFLSPSLETRYRRVTGERPPVTALGAGAGAVTFPWPMWAHEVVLMLVAMATLFAAGLATRPWLDGWSVLLALGLGVASLLAPRFMPTPRDVARRNEALAAYQSWAADQPR